MEFGATVCLPRKPMCLICPLRDGFRGPRPRGGFSGEVPRGAGEARGDRGDHLKKGKRFYCEQVPEGKPWHGLWRFPDFDPARMEQGKVLSRIKYGITKYSVTMQAVSAKWKSRVPPSGSYLTLEKMRTLAFAAPHRKLAQFLEK